ncbi:protein of unknown function [Chryseobacterium sp. RU37D]|uniref:DUF4249 domain-containing protein n=1 Tax=Chryseobacterium sp. RU37D TaxID=1907397 RepID=UPI000954794A|nr:DUF4249 domain-containing protein [Chryseobacterium sp. RU37D]SIQ06868.1 protein of unknown function [Chryseobacterium sp. RU37D]
MMKNIIKYLITFSLLTPLTGCEEIIELPLADESGKIVIEGEVDDAPGPYFIRITRSAKISDFIISDFPVVENAQVIIKDNHGQTETLKYQNGYYVTKIFTTKPGDIYTLSVKADGIEYVATSQMPKKVYLDDLSYKVVSDQNANRYYILPVYNDPVQKGNYYLFRMFERRYTNHDTALHNDDIGNGETNTKYLYSQNFFLGKNDTVDVEMQCIDKPVFDYFKALPSVILNGDPSGGVPPANPVSNISNGALGYFSAHTSDEKTIVLK